MPSKDLLLGGSFTRGILKATEKQNEEVQVSPQLTSLPQCSHETFLFN